MRFIIICIYFCLLLGNAAHGLKLRIIGGIYANIEEFPYLVSFRNIEDNIHFCAGSIISHWNVLSAAHCFEDLDHQFHDLRMYTGTSSSFDISGPTYTIAQIIIHADYQRAVTFEVSNLHDISIIKTNEWIEFNKYQHKINLPTRDVFRGNVGRLAGWGVTSFPDGEISPFLRQAASDIYDHVRCTENVPITIYETQLCSYQKIGISTCSGDSGGALVSNDEIFGIISFTFECNDVLPNVHTKVYSYLDFIKAHMINN